jgi:hypothetical protein
MMRAVPLAVLGMLVAAAALALTLAHGSGGSGASAGGGAAYVPGIPTPTWEKYCELGPAPQPWDSWEELFAHAKDVIEKYGPPPTPDPASFPTPEIDGPPPPGYRSWDDFADESLKVFEEIRASGAEARANCTHQQVCVETSRGPVCVAPAGEPAYFCAGDGCPTPEIWEP